MKAYTKTKEIQVSEMKPSTSIQEFQKNGFLFLESFLDPNMVKQAFESIKTNETNSLMSDQLQIKQNDKLMNVLEHSRLYELVELIFNRKTVSIPFKWLRKVGKGLYTGLHCDSVYVGKIHEEIITIWIPLSDIELERGSLVVCPKSHVSKEWKSIHEKYDDIELKNGTDSGWLGLEELGFEPKWVSRDFKMGDVVVLHSKVMHMTAMNVTDLDRYSVDTRWVPL